MFSKAIEIFHHGGWIMWPLLASALIAIFVSIERTIAIRRAASANADFMHQVRGLVTKNDFDGALRLCDDTRGPVPQLVGNGLRNRHLDNADIERSMEELALRETPLLQKRLGILDTVITMAPLLGLLGTITGMIQSFNVVSTAGSAAPTAITGGVAEALIATAAGLGIAITILPIYNWLTEKVKEIISEMEVSATEILNMLASKRSHGADSTFEARRAEVLVENTAR